MDGIARGICAGQVVAIDAKTPRRSFDDAHNRAFVHMLNAWAAQNRLVLGQIRTEAKSNEVTAIPKLLELLGIKGATVTIDAMGCQTEIVAAIVDRDTDYVLAVNENQRSLLEGIKACFAEAIDAPSFDAIVDFTENQGQNAWANGSPPMSYGLVFRNAHFSA